MNLEKVDWIFDIFTLLMIMDFLFFSERNGEKYGNNWPIRYIILTVQIILKMLFENYGI